jgi:hypothetical protein
MAPILADIAPIAAPGAGAIVWNGRFDVADEEEARRGIDEIERRRGRSMDQSTPAAFSARCMRPSA